MEQISYELAKELKDAGFPGSRDWQEHPHISGTPYFMVDGRGVPTLSELIEACGEEFACLSIARSIPEEPATKWQAQGWSHQFDAVIGDCPIPECCPDATVGSTPEEAVARLWLALNAPKKENTKDTKLTSN